ncbi:hypothetical protein HYV73_02145 [Candidatus Uhrbacteria bacterium]|nr:hypothetical protein [Candidatus Uhrbacteria bacterium]
MRLFWTSLKRNAKTVWVPVDAKLWAIARAFDRLGVSGNQVTGYRGLGIFPGVYLFSTNHWILATIILVPCFLGDNTDGLVARLQEARQAGPLPLLTELRMTWREIWKYKGCSQFGMAFDPFVDKVLVQGVLQITGGGIVHPGLMVGSICIALLSTWLRIIMSEIKKSTVLSGKPEPVFSIGANTWGKAKMVTEVGSLIDIVFPTFMMDHNQYTRANANVTLLASCILGLLSVLGQARGLVRYLGTRPTT